MSGSELVRRFVIYRADVLARAIDCVNELVINPTRPFEVIVRPLVEKRSNEQNALYWTRLQEIADQLWPDGRSFSAECWHEHCKEEVMQEVVELRNGELASKWIEAPGGRRYVRSTTDLSKKSFTEYIQRVEHFGASNGVMFSANPRQLPPRN